MQPTMDAQDEPEQPGQTDSPEEEAQEGVKFCVVRTPDGQFSVYQDGQDQDAVQAEDLEDALKALVHLVQAVPADNTPQAHYAAGFQSEHQNLKEY